MRRCQNCDGLRLAELLDAVASDPVVLHPDRPRLGPFAVGAEGDVALDRVKRVRARIFRQFVVVERLACLDGLPEDLQLAIGEGRQKIAEQVDPFGRRLRLFEVGRVEAFGNR